MRQTYGLGLGHDVLRGSRLQLDFLRDATYVRENGELLLGEKLSLKLCEHVSLDHFLNFYPNLTERGEFRMDTTSTLSTRLSSRLSFNTTVTNRFLSNPLPGRQKNEVILTTGLGFDF